MTRSSSDVPEPVRKYFAAMGRKGGLASVAKLSPEERERKSREGSRRRWIIYYRKTGQADKADAIEAAGDAWVGQERAAGKPRRPRKPRTPASERPRRPLIKAAGC
jgi:hypothetical protein